LLNTEQRELKMNTTMNNQSTEQPPLDGLKELLEDGNAEDFMRRVPVPKHQLQAILSELTTARQRVAELEKYQNFLQESMARVAQAEGISTPLLLMAMAENNEQTYTDLLVKHIVSQKEAAQATITAQSGEIEALKAQLKIQNGS